jgi:uncharacterized RDD family membrane protein YckC
MFCPQCGAQVEETAGFCSNCGAKMAASRPAVPEPMTAHAPMPAAPPSMAAPPPAAVPPGAAGTPSAQVKYAGFWIRWLANFIDSLIVSIPMVTLVMLASAAGIFSPGQGGPEMIFFLLMLPFAVAATWLYFAIQESSSEQATLGKRILGIKVIDYEGRRIGFARATGRFWGKTLSGILFNIGYIMAAFTNRKQALHDILAQTLVVRR